MGALVRLWIREHRLFIVGAVVFALLAVLAFLLLPITWSTSLVALAVVALMVPGGLSDTERGAK